VLQITSCETSHFALQLSQPKTPVSFSYHQTANMVAQSAEFKKAIEDSRSLSQTPTNDELLEV
jgi:hypothetical protein